MNPSTLSLGPLPRKDQTNPLETTPPPPHISRIKLSDIISYDGAMSSNYIKSVEALSGSLMRCNAVIIELESDDAAIMRCGLESVRMWFKMKAGSGGGGGGGGGRTCRYMYKAGRSLEEEDSAPPCMYDVYRCIGKAARAALCAIARHLRLRTDAFSHLLDDTPLSAHDISSSVLVASYCYTVSQNEKGVFGAGKPSARNETEKGLLTLISSNSPGLQVCDPNGCWYLADADPGAADLLLLTGKALSHVTAGLRPAATYRAAPDFTSGNSNMERISLAFRLMPQNNAILDCSPIAVAGHVTPQSYRKISVSQFMDDLAAEEDFMCSTLDNIHELPSDLSKESSLRSVLSDSISGAFLHDAVVVSCGHSFGGLMLKKVIEVSRCSICNAEIGGRSLIPNLALRAAAAAVKHEDDQRPFHNAILRKRRKEGNGDIVADGDSPIEQRGVQYPFSVDEKVIIKGNRRTLDKFVGNEAVITSQGLNGWYRLKILGSGECVCLQYRSLKKISCLQTDNEKFPSQLPNQTGVHEP